MATVVKSEQLGDYTGITFMRYRLDAKVNNGGFGHIYSVTDVYSGAQLIAKVEQGDSVQSKNEAAILENLNLWFFMNGGDVHEPIAHFYGAFSFHNVECLLMEPLGPNLRDLKKSTPFDRFSLRTSLFVAQKMVEALQFVHERDYVHRDVKPNNFCLGRRNGDRRVFVIDFGVAKRYDKSDEVAKEHVKSSFVGTSRYASYNTLAGYDDGKAGDMWGVYYTLLENVLGQVPWRQETNRQAIMPYKKQLQETAVSCKQPVTHPWFEGPRGPPPSMVAFLRHLQKARFSHDIDHSLILSALCYDLHMLKYDSYAPCLDWEACGFHDEIIYEFWDNPFLATITSYY
uniref:non-specific serine/threonine protein kinase n=1 Tax=Panagrellus redivivus TaxID=6233 RepID=A0A7E4VK89_PANRE